MHQTERASQNVSDNQIESNANNAMHGEVSPNTGQLKIALSPPKLPVAAGMHVDLGISYTQNFIITDKTVLGLPEGWGFNLSYIIGNRIFISGQQSYIIDSDTDSGMRYYKLKNAQLQSVAPTEFPYDSTEKYVWKLSLLGGITQYFDANGRLLGVADKNDNCILYYYNETGQDVRSSTLQKLITRVAGSNYQQVINVSYSGDVFNGHVLVNYPSGGSNTIAYQFVFEDGKMVKYHDPLGRDTVIAYGGGVVKNDLISAINFPNGLRVTYQYGEILMLLPGQPGGVQAPQDVVTVVSRIDATHGAPQARMTKYDYNPLGDQHNYTGFPDHVTSVSEDSLMQSNDNGYMYHTQVDDGIVITDHQFNRLHLELKVTKTTSKGNKIISEKVNTYQDEGGENFFPPVEDLSANFQTPVEVTTTLKNDADQERIFQTKSTFSDSAQLTRLEIYESQTDSKAFQLIKLTTASYDPTYGLLVQKEISDFQPDGTIVSNPRITRYANTLSADKKFIVSSQVGFVVKGTFQADKRRSFEYDAAGRVTDEVLEWVDADQKPGPASTTLSRKYDYDTSKHLLTVSQTDGEGQTVQKIIDTTTGFTLKLVNAVGREITKTYDDFGRITASTNIFGATSTLAYTSGDANKMNQVTASHPNGYKTYSYINAFGEELKKSDNMGSGGERVLWTKTYNDLGQLIATEGITGPVSLVTYQYSDRGKLMSQTDALGNINAFDHDQVSQTNTKTFNLIKTSSATYNDSNKVTLGEAFSSDSKGSIVSHSLFNANGLEVHTVIGDESDQSAHWISQDRQYDATGFSVSNAQTGWDGVMRLEELTRNLLNQTTQTSIKVTQSGEVSQAESSTLVHDAMGRLLQAISPLKQVERFTYDAMGNIATHIDYAGNTFATTYDYDHATVTQSFKDDGDWQVVRQLSADTGLVVSVEHFKNQVSQGKIQFSYTLNGMLESMIYPDGKTIQCTYDQYNRVESFTDVLGHVSAYSYDDSGRLQGVAVDRNYSVSMTYWSKNDSAAWSGQLKTVTHANGLVTAYTYNGFNSVASMAVTDPSQPDKRVSVVKYAYEPTTQAIASIQYQSDVSEELGANCTKQFEYNSLNQLILETVLDGKGTTVNQANYAYDAAGNVISKTVQSGGQKETLQYSYNAGNQLTTITYPDHQVQLSYDRNGNILNDGLGNLYTYNVLNQMVTHTDAKGQLTGYTYYPTGLRATKQPAGQPLVQYYYDHAKAANIINEVQGESSTFYLIAGSSRHARLYVEKTGGAPEMDCYIQDVRDNHAVTNADKQIETLYDYEAYGQAVTGDTESAFNLKDNPFKYTKAYLDAESGLYYLRARYYDPRLMCFISQDSSILFNRYSYASGNPISMSDSSGHTPEWVNYFLGGLTILVSLTGVVAGAMMTASGVGSAIGVPLLASGVLGVGSGATGVAASDTKGHLSEDLNYASLALGIGSAVIGGYAGLKGWSAVAAAPGEVASETGAEIESASRITLYSFRAMYIATLFGVASGVTGIAAQIEHSQILADLSMGLGFAALGVGLVSGPTLRGNFEPKGEVYYANMSTEQVTAFDRTGEIPEATQLFLSPSRDSLEDVEGSVIMRFKVRAGTTKMLNDMRVIEGVLEHDEIPEDCLVFDMGPIGDDASFDDSGPIIRIDPDLGWARRCFTEEIIKSEVVRS